jgi:hypothetical protein
MQKLVLSDTLFHTIESLAAARGQSPEEFVAALVEQEQWEEHAVQAYDAYHSRSQGPTETLSEEEFFEWLRDGAQTEHSDADV